MEVSQARISLSYLPPVGGATTNTDTDTGPGPHTAPTTASAHASAPLGWQEPGSRKRSWAEVGPTQQTPLAVNPTPTPVCPTPVDPTAAGAALVPLPCANPASFSPQAQPVSAFPSRGSPSSGLSSDNLTASTRCDTGAPGAEKSAGAYHGATLDAAMRAAGDPLSLGGQGSCLTAAATALKGEAGSRSGSVSRRQWYTAGVRPLGSDIVQQALNRLLSCQPHQQPQQYQHQPEQPQQYQHQAEQPQQYQHQQHQQAQYPLAQHQQTQNHQQQGMVYLPQTQQQHTSDEEAYERHPHPHLQQLPEPSPPHPLPCCQAPQPTTCPVNTFRVPLPQTPCSFPASPAPERLTPPAQPQGPVCQHPQECCLRRQPPPQPQHQQHYHQQQQQHQLPQQQQPQQQQQQQVGCCQKASCVSLPQGPLTLFSPGPGSPSPGTLAVASAVPSPAAAPTPVTCPSTCPVTCPLRALGTASASPASVTAAPVTVTAAPVAVAATGTATAQCLPTCAATCPLRATFQGPVTSPVSCPMTCPVGPSQLPPTCVGPCPSSCPVARQAKGSTPAPRAPACSGGVPLLADTRILGLGTLIQSVANQLLASNRRGNKGVLDLGSCQTEVQQLRQIQNLLWDLNCIQTQSLPWVEAVNHGPALSELSGTGAGGPSGKRRKGAPRDMEATSRMTHQG